MRYMFLIYTTETEEGAASPEERQEVIDRHRAVMDETARRGILVGADPLAPTPTATTVRSDGGKIVLMDGPFAETKEQLAGFYLIDAADLNEAILVAAKIPPAREGSVEVRPIRELSAQ